VTEAGLAEETEKDSLDRELDLIRARREGDKRFFRGAFEDYTLLTGIIIGAVFFGGVFIMSSGWVASDSIVIDKTLSTTPLDPGDEVSIDLGDYEGDASPELYDTWASESSVQSAAMPPALPGFGALLGALCLLGAAFASRRD